MNLMKPTKDHSILDIKEVTKLFGSKVAVNNLSLVLNKGEIFGFLGPNGAGKTTTIRMILDVLRPSKGSIGLFGKSNKQTKETHSRLGYLSGEMAIDGDLTGNQYLRFVDHYYGGSHQKQAKELANLLDIGLETKIESYSRGNKQKLALISALMHEPELLILDEPTSGFDPLVQETFLQLLKKYRVDGGTVFMSSHILSEVQRLCSRVGFIKDGSLIGVKTLSELHTGSSKTIRARAPATALAKIKSSYKKLDGLIIQKSDEESVTFGYSGEIQPVLEFFGQFKLSDIIITEPNLEEIFLKYYEQGDV